jgi:hypothetical protein
VDSSLASLAEEAAGAASCLPSSEGSICTAGEAGIVLRRFLPSETPALRSEEIKGLVVLRCVVDAAVFDAGVVGALVLVGLKGLDRAVGFFSDGGEE